MERGVRESNWLDQHGDWIQILVTQNYLFFGNCQSLLNYITTMFEDDGDDAVEEESAIIPLPPKPKYLILDFSLISGMDTSVVDIIQEIVALCSNDSNRCRLYLSGLKPTVKSNLLYAGLRPSGPCSSEQGLQQGRPNRRAWMYTHDMETALAEAEDALLSTESHLEQIDQEKFIQRKGSDSLPQSLDNDNDNDNDNNNTGFLYALQKIDEQHGLQTVTDLGDLIAWTQPMELESGEMLTRVDGEPGGLYFVETGLLRVQRSLGSNHTTRYSYNTLQRRDGSHGFSTPAISLPDPSADSIGHMNVRSATIGREVARWNEQHQHGHLQQQTPQDHHHVDQQQSFRLARIGQGWIIGSIEVVNGMKRPGVFVAMTSCRLHYLSRHAIQELQRDEKPRLAMYLYRTLSHLATKRQEMTIDHLGQHLRILNSPVPRLRGHDRMGLMATMLHDDTNEPVAPSAAAYSPVV